MNNRQIATFECGKGGFPLLFRGLGSCRGSVAGRTAKLNNRRIATFECRPAGARRVDNLQTSPELGGASSNPDQTPMRALAVLAALLAIPAAAAAEPAIGKIEARLFYEASGRLSDNIAPPAEIALFNTVIGEGGAEEPAGDVLVAVTVAGEAGSFVETPLTIRVVAIDDGSVLAERKIEGLLLSAQGSVTRAVFVPDSTCRAFRIEAAIGESKASAEIPFVCGE